MGIDVFLLLVMLTSSTLNTSWVEGCYLNCDGMQLNPYSTLTKYTLFESTKLHDSTRENHFRIPRSL